MARLNASIKAFREPDLLSNPLDFDTDFNDFDARRLRYSIYWTFYENTSYREIHTWAKRYKVDYGLYKYIRNVHNPSYRLGEFWKTHLWGGGLSVAAGEPSAIPLLTEEDSDELKAAIAQVWQWSNWQIKKDVTSLYGAILGDVGLMVVDDPIREKVYLDVVHPGTIESVELDDFGNVKAYRLVEERADPANSNRTVTYAEEAFRDGDSVIYQTFLNGNLFPWNGIEAEWERPYGFIPLVLIQHNNVGLDWGWSELHPLRSKIHEVDDLVSKLDDQIRKSVDAAWLFVNIDKPDTSPTTTETALTGTAAINRPQPGREEVPALYASEGGNAIPLVAPLDITATSEHIEKILAEIERDHPELQMDIWQAGGDTSGRALRIARQRTETKVNQRRAGYDDALRRAQQMAVAIGGEQGYFEGFGLNSFEEGNLDHTIDKRPVFATDPLDILEEVKAKADIIDSLVKSGASIDGAAQVAGLTEEEAALLSQIDLGVLER